MTLRAYVIRYEHEGLLWTRERREEVMLECDFCVQSSEPPPVGSEVVVTEVIHDNAAKTLPHPGTVFRVTRHLHDGKVVELEPMPAS